MAEEKKKVKTIWRSISEEQGFAPATDEEGRPLEADGKRPDAPKARSESEAFVLLVGQRSSGKSTIRNLYRMSKATSTGKKPREIPIEPTVALEYSAAYRITDKERTVVSLWELESSLGLSELLKVVITARRLRSLVVVYVLDTSQPKTALRSLQRWHAAVDELIQAGQKEARDSGLEAPPVPQVIVGSKTDLTKPLGKEVKKLLDALRFMAIQYSASLFFFSPSNPQLGSDLVAFLDSTIARRPPAAPARISSEWTPYPAGSDNLEMLSKSAAQYPGTTVQSWLDFIDKSFEQVIETEKEALDWDEGGEEEKKSSIENEVETQIDQLRKEKADELKSFTKEERRNEKLAKKR